MAATEDIQKPREGGLWKWMVKAENLVGPGVGQRPCRAKVRSPNKELPLRSEGPRELSYCYLLSPLYELLL